MKEEKTCSHSECFFNGLPQPIENFYVKSSYKDKKYHDHYCKKCRNNKNEDSEDQEENSQSAIESILSQYNAENNNNITSADFNRVINTVTILSMWAKRLEDTEAVTRTKKING